MYCRLHGYPTAPLISYKITGIGTLWEVAVPLSELSITLDFPPNLCHPIGMKQITFDSNGIYASDARLRSIALECLEQERQERACRRASRAAGVQWDNWHISDRH